MAAPTVQRLADKAAGILIVVYQMGLAALPAGCTDAPPAADDDQLAQQVLLESENAYRSS